MKRSLLFSVGFHLLIGGGLSYLLRAPYLDFSLGSPPVEVDLLPSIAYRIAHSPKFHTAKKNKAVAESVADKDSQQGDEKNPTPVPVFSSDDIIAMGNVPPRYPREAEDRSLEGDVELLLYLENQRVSKIDVLRGATYAGFEKSAREAAIHWQVPKGWQGREKIRVVFAFRLLAD